MIDAGFFMGYPKDFKGICKVYPPKIKDILSQPSYAIFKSLLTQTQEDIEDAIIENGGTEKDLVTPFEYLMSISNTGQVIKVLILQAFEFFIHEPVTILFDQQTIIIGDLEQELKQIQDIKELRYLKQEDFFDFQNLIRKSLGEKEAEPYNPNENPKIKYFKAKARLRDRVKAKNSKDGLDFGSTLAAICCMNLGLNPLNIGELSYCAISVLMRYYQEKSKYEIDIQSLLAGADSKKIKPKYWIRKIEDL